MSQQFLFTGFTKEMAATYPGICQWPTNNDDANRYHIILNNLLMYVLSDLSHIILSYCSTFHFISLNNQYVESDDNYMCTMDKESFNSDTQIYFRQPIFNISTIPIKLMQIKQLQIKMIENKLDTNSFFAVGIIDLPIRKMILFDENYNMCHFTYDIKNTASVNFNQKVSFQDYNSRHFQIKFDE